MQSETNEMDEARAELEALRARKAAAERAREEREEREQLRREVEAERIAAENAEAILAAEEELGERGLYFATYETPRGVVVLKRPNRLKFKKFQDDGKFSTATLTGLVMPCVHYPKAETFEDWLDEFPGILAPVASAVVELAQGKRKELEGKS